MKNFTNFLLITIFFFLSFFTSVDAIKRLPPGTGAGDVPANILLMMDSSTSMTSASEGYWKEAPNDVAIDSEGNIWVVFHYAHKVIKYDSEGEVLLTIGNGNRGHCSSGEQYYPFGITIDSSDNIWVSQYGSNIVCKFDENGTYQAYFQAQNPRGIAIDGSTLWVTFSESHWSQGAFNKRSVANCKSGYCHIYYQSDIDSGGGACRDPSSKIPTDLEVDSDGNVYVTDHRCHRVKKYNSSGTFLLTFGVKGHPGGPSILSVAWGITVDSSDNIYVSSEGKHYVQKFNSSGTYIGTVGEWGSGTSKFSNPYGLDVDSSDNIYVADFYNYRIQKFTSDLVYVDSIGQLDRYTKAAKVFKEIFSNTALSSGVNWGFQQWATNPVIENLVDKNGISNIPKILDDIDIYHQCWGRASGPKAWKPRYRKDVYLDQNIYPGCATYLGKAVQEAKQYFNDANQTPIDEKLKDCQKNYLVILSDGYWADDPIPAVKDLAKQGIKTFIIGYKIDGNKSNYEKLAEAGGSNYPMFADTQHDLLEKFSDALLQISRDKYTFSAPVLMPETKTGNFIIQSVFDVEKNDQWKGYLKKYKLNSDEIIAKGGALIDPTAPVLEAGKLLKEKKPDDRNIWTSLDGITASINNFTTSNYEILADELFKGVSTWAGRTNNQETVENLIKFTRGYDSYDTDNDGSTNDTDRWKLADIYHSSPVYVSSPSASYTIDPETSSKSEVQFRAENDYASFVSNNSRSGKEIILVGSNAGMLHAFDATTLEEKWAFIPPSMLSKLRNVMDGTQTEADKGLLPNHKTKSIYGVDGTLTVKDIYDSTSSSWKTIALVGLRDGGKSYTAIDITDTENPTHLFTFENNTFDKSIHYWDEDGISLTLNYGESTPDSEYDYSKLANAYSTPVIQKIRYNGDDKWAAIFGAGLDESSDLGSAVYVIDLNDGGKVLKKIELNDSDKTIYNSVSATMTFITADTATKADYYGSMAYVPDYEGRLWKINFTDQGTFGDTTILFDGESNSTNHRFSFFKASSTIDKTDNDLLWLYFGTGNQHRLNTTGENIETSGKQKWEQSNLNRLFGIKDKNFHTFSKLEDKDVIKVSNNPNNGSRTGDYYCVHPPECPTSVHENKKGWFVNLRDDEKVTSAPTSVQTKISGVGKGVVFFSRFIPNDDPCKTGNAYASQHNYDCGAGTAGYGNNGIKDMGQGVLTGSIFYQGRQIVGISGSVSKTGPDGFTKTGELLVSDTPIIDDKDSGDADIKSWREWF